MGAARFLRVAYLRPAQKIPDQVRVLSARFIRGERFDTMIRARITRFRAASGIAYRSIRDLTEREKKHLLSEILQVRGLMPLLMKPRNNQRWTPEDRAELRSHLRRISDISPYLIVLALPGSFLMLPALAWWLDRRRNRKQPGPATPT